ncbi:unnamed protein product [Meganyctiphanes norvegica]|uniref:Uncharacterized protein n=1 Tax=Meganyctiphanes norvegica TaxID=48144 RepID=A0AAV2S8J2_MEGNR
MALLVDHGAEISARDCPFNQTPLHWAAEGNKSDAVLWLLSQPNVDAEATDVDGLTAADLADRAGHTDLAARLRDSVAAAAAAAAAMAAAIAEHGSLHDNAYEGNNEVVLQLLDIGCDVNIRGRGHKKTALHYAAETGHVDIMATLHQRGAKVMAKDRWGHTPLHHAAENNHEYACVWLKELQPVVDIAAVDGHGRTAADMAEEKDHTDLAQMLRTPSLSEKTSTHYAAECGDTYTMATLHQRGAIMTAKDRLGNTLLHYAAENNHSAACEWLLKLQPGVDIEAENGRERTAAQLAEEKGHTDLAQMLRDKACSLHWAASVGKTDLVLRLLHSEQDVNATDGSQFRQTPMHRAAGGGHIETMATLRENGADVLATDYFGRTSLHVAARNNRQDACDWLMALPEMDLQVWAQDASGFTAVDVAENNEHIILAARLRATAAAPAPALSQVHAPGI